MRFKGMGRDRKYEIRDTKYGIETNVERPVQNIEWKYKVQSRDSYLDQNFATKGYASFQEGYFVLRTLFSVLPACRQTGY
jgi:hypothetical protein